MIAAFGLSTMTDPVAVVESVPNQVERSVVFERLVWTGGMMFARHVCETVWRRHLRWGRRRLVQSRSAKAESFRLNGAGTA